MDKKHRQDLANELGIGIETLRYYEKKGLIKAPQRSRNGYRAYSRQDAENVKHILLLKASGFTLKEILSFSTIKDPGQEEIKKIILTKINEIENKMLKLNEVKQNLLGVLETINK